MGSHFSQGSEDSISDSNAPESPSSASAKPTPQPEGSSPDTGPKSQSHTTFESFNWQAGGSRDFMSLQEGQTTALHKGQTPAVLMSSSVGSRVRTCPSPVDGPDSPVNGPASSSKQPESLTLFSDPEGGSSLRTFPDSFPQTVDGISESFSRRWPTSGFMTAPGECWTADTSECPKGGGEFSSLPDVLEADVPARFFLSPRAAAGILRRAGKRGRELPRHLAEALRELASQHRDEGRKTT